MKHMNSFANEIDEVTSSPIFQTKIIMVQRTMVVKC
jgi:hypothetical protein